MPRSKSLTSVDAKIKKIQLKMIAAQKRYDRLAEELKGLNDERARIEADLIAAAFRKSGKSFSQLMTFLNR